MTNCPNCGSPIEPYKCRCEYCGTYYFDFTAFDMSRSNLYYVKFKASINGHDTIITALAEPKLEKAEIIHGKTNVLDENDKIIDTFTHTSDCNFNVRFHCYVNPETNTLYQIEVKDNE